MRLNWNSKFKMVDLIPLELQYEIFKEIRDPRGIYNFALVNKQLFEVFKRKKEKLLKMTIEISSGFNYTKYIEATYKLNGKRLKVFPKITCDILYELDDFYQRLVRIMSGGSKLFFKYSYWYGGGYCFGSSFKHCEKIISIINLEDFKIFDIFTPDIIRSNDEKYVEKRFFKLTLEKIKDKFPIPCEILVV